MSNLIPFSFESHEVRFVPNGDSFSVVAKDVAEALEYAYWQPNIVSHVPEEWKGIHRINTLGGTQEMLTLTEQGLYFFINRSDKPKALPLQKWVAGEVLPSIRKTGSFSLPGATPQNTVLAAQLAELLKGKVLVDYETLRLVVGGALAARNVLDSLEVMAQGLEAECGQPLVDGLMKGQYRADSVAGSVVPRQPVQHGSYKKQSLAEYVLDFITAKQNDGAGHRALQQYCRPYREATDQERTDALNRLLDQGAIVQVQPESLPGARRKALVYVARQFVREVAK